MARKKRKVNRVFISLLILVVSLILILLIINQNNKNNYEISNELSFHNYDFMNLVKDDYRYIYGDNSQFGIDVSSHNGLIDWNEVDVTDLDFVYVRLGYRGYTSGELHLDEFYESNMEQLVKTKLKLGIYWFPQAISEQEAIEEAEFVLGKLENYKISLPVVIDLETIHAEGVRRANLTNEERTTLTNIFLERIKSKGYKTMIYSNYYYLTDFLKLEDLASNYFWIANYNDNIDYPYNFQMWQYSDQGKINGIGELVDYNILFNEFN